MTVTEFGAYVFDWLNSVLQIFRVDLVFGLSGLDILIGVLFVDLAIFVFRKFFNLSNSKDD